MYQCGVHHNAVTVASCIHRQMLGLTGAALINKMSFLTALIIDTVASWSKL